jgi:hypothetical protein
MGGGFQEKGLQRGADFEVKVAKKTDSGAKNGPFFGVSSYY